ncbi:MAG TPA: tetratricopeptide repeat protein [Tepidisphaeraceae bacterium]|nr:tetratricopeptide repeat protein [Tepidisphaeraceae bacterium]
MSLRQAFDLAVQYQDAGRYREAEEIFRQILAQHPNEWATLDRLGALAFRQGRPQEAVDWVQRAVGIYPASHGLWSNLGILLAGLNRFEEAVAAFERAIALRPDSPQVHNNLGNALQALNRTDDAAAAYRRAVELKPDYAQAMTNLAGALSNSNDLDEAIDACQRAIAMDPKPDQYTMLGRVYKLAGRLDDAIAAFRKANELHPSSLSVGDILFTAHFHPGYDRKRLFEEHVAWYRQYASALRYAIAPHTNEPDPDRRLRVGYVAFDLGDNALGRLLLPLLSHHNHEQFEVFCYCQLRRQGPTAGDLQAAADVWRLTAGLSDAQLAEHVRHDRIDILVDLNMHSNSNRLLTFAHKPAPVQVTYLAYAGTTGLDTIDYRLTDRYLDPPGWDESAYTEKSVRLPHCFWCYPEPTYAPDVGPLPAASNGHITFGCLNEYAKMTIPSVQLWCRVMREAPDSKLIVHSRMGRHREQTIEQVRSAGIDPARLSFAPFHSIREYFEQYNAIDIAFDTFPWAGGITTCDALWMGVPVISLPGERATSRGGLSILSNIGLPELAPSDPDRFVQVATELANDRPRHQNLRATLRERMRTSPLMDAPQFARDVESAYREMWRTWCQARSNSAI